MFKSLLEWTHYLETLNPHKIALGLERVATVATVLGLGKFACPVITVTGTNGKGSCVNLLESAWLAGNYRVGAYTSPHLFHFNERIRTNGIDMDDSSLCDAFARVAAASNGVPLTYFEFTTLAALTIFQQANLDVVILEAGLGGRLDAVNIVDADVAIITTVAIDHTDWLGPDRDSIGREKAGIFRANKPAICGDFNPPASVFESARQLQSSLYCQGKDYVYETVGETTGPTWDWKAGDVVLTALPKPTLQLQNAATALMAIQLLQEKLPLSKNALMAGLMQANLPGRLQQVGQLKTCIFDVAHNPEAARCLAQQLQNTSHSGKTHAVVGMMTDKDITGTLGAVAAQIDAWYVGSLPGPRGAPKSQMMTALRALGMTKCYNYDLITMAYREAMLACEAADRVIVFGSFVTVAACWLEWQQRFYL